MKYTISLPTAVIACLAFGAITAYLKPAKIQERYLDDPSVALSFDTRASSDLPMWECQKLVARCDAIDPRTDLHMQVCGSRHVSSNDVNRWIERHGE